MLVGPILLGLVVDAYGFSTALLAGGAVVLVGVLTVIAFIPNRKLATTSNPTS